MEFLIAQLTELFDSFFGNEILPGIVKWSTIAVALLFVELIHRAWLVVWFSLGALSAGIVSIFVPNEVIQFGVFFAVSAVSLAVFVYYRREDDTPPPVIPDGKKVRVHSEINGAGEGSVLVDGIPFKARLEIPGPSVKQSEWVEICGFDADELTALVKPIEESQPQVGN